MKKYEKLTKIYEKLIPKALPGNSPPFHLSTRGLSPGYLPASIQFSSQRWSDVWAFALDLWVFIAVLSSRYWIYIAFDGVSVYL